MPTPPSRRTASTPANPWADPELLAAMSPNLLALARRGALRRFAANSVLIQEGDQGDTLFVILGGQLEVYGEDPLTGRRIIYGIYGKGEYVGEMSLDGGARSAHVRSTTDTLCSVVTRSTLMQHIQEDPAFAMELLAKIIWRARHATLSAKQLALNDVYGRLRAFLLQHPAEADGRIEVRPAPTQVDIASRLGCTREMVSRLMRDLRRGGYVEVASDAWTVLRPLPPKW